MATPTADTYTAAVGATLRGGRGGAAPPPTYTAPVAKYRFQQPLLFQRAHAKRVPFRYEWNGEVIERPALDHTFHGPTGGDGVYCIAQVCGSRESVVCSLSQWKWANAGGDWLGMGATVSDAPVAQGNTAWATGTLAAAAPAGELSLDVTNLIRYCDTDTRWYAMVLRVTSGTLRFIGPLNAGAAKSVLEIVRGGVTETWDLWYSCTLRKTSSSDVHDDVQLVTTSTKAVLEFFRPTDQSVPVSSATLKLRHDGNTGGTVSFGLFVANPQVPASLDPIPGIASAYTLDTGIMAHANVAAAMLVRDTTVMGDIVDLANSPEYSGMPNLRQVRQEAKFDPYLWGTPGVGHMAHVAPLTTEQRNAKFPNCNVTADGVKMVGSASRSEIVGDGIRLLTGADLTARGLPVLAPGLGAFEMRYIGTRTKNYIGAWSGLTSGGTLADGATGCDFDMFLKGEHIGRVVDGYMRMYVMLGEGWEPNDNFLRMSWSLRTGADYNKLPEEAGTNVDAVQWRVGDMTGKFPGGIQQLTNTGVKWPKYNFPTRLNDAGELDESQYVGSGGGGYSGASGIYGYQGRWMFSQGFYKENHIGPACGGARIGIELYDFGPSQQMIPSQGVISGWDSTWQGYSTHIGGIGHLYPRKWYSVEMRWKLNSLVYPYAEPPVGTHYLESGFEVDGYLQWWVDGILAATSPMFATRSSRVVDWLYQVANGAPFQNDPDTSGSYPSMRPMTNVPPELYMGATSAILQTYFGGRSPNPNDKSVLLNGIVVSNGAYIGPMRGVSRENGGIPIV